MMDTSGSFTGVHHASWHSHYIVTLYSIIRMWVCGMHDKEYTQCLSENDANSERDARSSGG